MSDKKNKWDDIENYYNSDHLVEPIATLKQNIFHEDKLVLTDTFEESCETLKEISLEKYKELVDLASKSFALIDQLADKIKDAQDWKINASFRYYNKDSWMERQNKIAELDPETATRSTISQIEESTERYYPELHNSKMIHIGDLGRSVDEVGVELGHFMAHLTAIINNPDHYLFISEDKTKGQAPF